MKIALYASLFFLGTISAYAQQYDLLVKINGDSIACRMDSITTTQYFFEMRINGVWVHTHINQSEVINYEAGAVDMKATKFIHGSSIIEPYS